jgi:hypothetical protein
MIQSANQVKERRLTRPGASHQCNRLPGRDLQGHPVQRHHGGPVLPESAGDEVEQNLDTTAVSIG